MGVAVSKSFDNEIQRCDMISSQMSHSMRGRICMNSLINIQHDYNTYSKGGFSDELELHVVGPSGCVLCRAHYFHKQSKGNII